MFVSIWSSKEYIADRQAVVGKKLKIKEIVELLLNATFEISSQITPEAVKRRSETCNFIKKGTLAQGFPVNFAKFFRKPIFIKHYGDHFYHSMVSPIFTCPDKKSLSLTFCESMT